MKTPLQNLIDELTPISEDSSTSSEMRFAYSMAIAKAKQILEKEKRIIEGAFQAGFNNGFSIAIEGDVDKIYPDEYYTETFKTV